MSGASRRTPKRSPTPSAEPFILTLWTADPELARAADAAGIDRVGVDLEWIGKLDRQAGRGTWLSQHVEEDLDRVGGALTRAKLFARLNIFARLNPLNPASPSEVESVLVRGAQVLMLPMIMDAEEAARFVALVGGRATVVLLVEHIDAVRRLGAIVRVEGVDEIHLGLNDLSLSLGLANRWLALAGDLVIDAGAIVRGAGLRFGLGGIGRAGDAELPVPTELVYAEYARTGATAALLSRSFFNKGGAGFSAEVVRTRRALESWRRRSPADLEAAHAELGRRAALADCW